MKKKLPVSLILFLLTIVAINNASAQRGRVSNANGTVVSDIGSNLRGCFVYLDYQEGGNLPAGTKEKIMQLPTRYGMNAIHLYLEKYDSPTGINASLCDSLVQYTYEAKIYLIITIGCGDRNGSFDYNQSVNFWKFYAGRYAGKTHVIYEIHNEPINLCNDPSDTALINMEVACYKIIRRRAPSTHVMFFSYSSVPHTVPMETDIKNLERKGVSFSNASIAYHGYYWCVFARQNGGYPNNTEREAISPIQQKGYSFINTEFDHDSTFDGDKTYSGHLLKFLEEDRKVSWLSFFDLLGTLNGSDKPLTTAFKRKTEQDSISWCPDFGTWPKNAGSCKNSFAKAAADINTGAQNHLKANTFSVFPNPAENYFFIRLPINVITGKAQLTITDVFGRTVKTMQVQNNLEKININGLAKGIYTVELSNAKKKCFSKLIIE